MQEADGGDFENTGTVCLNLKPEERIINRQSKIMIQSRDHRADHRNIIAVVVSEEEGKGVRLGIQMRLYE